jgi:nucleotidyltransferase substrate binding protein (TIGR01987 family)
MARLTERVDVARAALRTLDEVLRETVTKIVRDAAIQRFEYTHEAVWKAAQAYLAEVEGARYNAPKSAYRACFRAGLLNEDEARLAVEMVDDRNRTAHTYNERVAQRIFDRVPSYLRLMQTLVEGFAREGR